MIGFWSVNAQSRRIMTKEQERNILTKRVRPIVHRNSSTGPTATVVLEEDFNTGTLPTGWTVNDNSTGGAGPWTFVSDYTDSGNNVHTLDGTSFAFVNSDAYGQSVTVDTELVSPVVDVSALNHVFISFDQYFQTYSGADTADVDVFDGAQWVTVFSTSSNIGSWESPDHSIIDVTAYKNANFQVKFHYYNANWEWYWAVDNFKLYEPDDNDLAIIDAVPGTFVPNSGFTLKAKINNVGGNWQSVFDVTFDIKDSSNTSVFNETVNLTGAGLAPISTGYVTTNTQPSLAVGDYTLEVTVSLTGDNNSSNDTFSAPLHIIDYAGTYNTGTVYSYDTSDGSTTSFDQTTGAVSTLGTAVTSDIFAAGTFFKDILVGVEFGTNNLYFIDGATGAAYKYDSFTGDINVMENNNIITGIAYDSALNIGYICTPTGFYTFDQNLNTTFIGAMNNGGNLMIGIAVDNNGNVYGIDIADDQLYSIDTTTGAASAIGGLGINLNYLQDIGADPATGNLYGTLYLANNGGSGLYSIDKVTGTATLIGSAITNEYTVCAIYDSAASISENHIAGLKVYPNPTNGMLLVDAKESIQSIAIVNLTGQVVKTFDNDGLKAQLDISDLATGNYILKITTDKTVGSYQIIKK